MEQSADKVIKNDGQVENGSQLYLSSFYWQPIICTWLISTAQLFDNYCLLYISKFCINTCVYKLQNCTFVYSKFQLPPFQF